MQLDREGVDDSAVTSNRVDLEKHFKEHGLSNTAYMKIARDISNGDMNVDILVKFTENELSLMGDDYKFTRLQKKAFIEAVKLLPNSKVSSHKSKVNRDVPPSPKHIYVSPQEQELFDEMTQLNLSLADFQNKCLNTSKQNKFLIETNIIKLKKYGERITQSVDKRINHVIKQV